MNRQSFLIAILAAQAILASSCTRETPKLQPPAPPKEVKKTQGSAIFKPSVDILFVIDDSGSMDTHQQRLHDNFDLFINAFQKNTYLDYHIGVMSTDDAGSSKCQTERNGCLVGSNYKYIQRSTPNGLTELLDMLIVGTGGNGLEKVFDPMIAGLSAPMTTSLNVGFLRPSAHLAVIAITDAEDQSSMYNDSQKAYNELVKIKGGAKDKVLAYGAFIPPDSTTNCPKDSTIQNTQSLVDFVNYANGKYYDLCDATYGEKLAQVSDDIVQRVGRIVNLDRLPDISSIYVQFGSRIIPNSVERGWIYDPVRNAVVFARDIDWSGEPDGTSVEVFFLPMVEQ